MKANFIKLDAQSMVLGAAFAVTFLVLLADAFMLSPSRILMNAWAFLKGKDFSLLLLAELILPFCLLPMFLWSVKENRHKITKKTVDFDKEIYKSSNHEAISSVRVTYDPVGDHRPTEPVSSADSVLSLPAVVASESVPENTLPVEEEGSQPSFFAEEIISPPGEISQEDAEATGTEIDPSEETETEISVLAEEGVPTEVSTVPLEIDPVSDPAEEFGDPYLFIAEEPSPTTSDSEELPSEPQQQLSLREKIARLLNEKGENGHA